MMTKKKSSASKDLVSPVSSPWHVAMTMQASGKRRAARKVLHWASRYDPCCVLQHNGYRGYPYQDYELLAGVGATAYVAAGKRAFERLKLFRKAHPGWCFGHLSYDLKAQIEALPSRNPSYGNPPELYFFRPKYVVAITAAGELHIETSGNRSAADIRREIESVKLPDTQTPHLHNKVHARTSRADYLETVRRIIRHIRRGDCYELNYCQEFYVPGAEVEPVAVYDRLNAHGRAPFAAFYHSGPHYLMSQSPERFLKKQGDRLVAQPIKGTRPRDEDAAQDKRLLRALQTSEKDRAENMMIVDLVRNDLARSATTGSVQVEELCGSYSFARVHQLISTVTAQLHPDCHPVDAIRHAFPMGSMTGAPKVKAMELIEKYENFRRGLFSGAVGYFTPQGDFDFNVVIRSMRYYADNKYLSYPAGGAITSDSDPEQEYEETLLKAEGMFEVFGK